jgi:hypothetical protein
MRSLLGVFAVYGIIKVVLLLLGFAVGWLIHWLIPSIEFGMAVLIGVVASGFSIMFFSRIATPFPYWNTFDDITPEESPVAIIESPASVRRKNRRR